MTQHYQINGTDVREVRDWGRAIVLQHDIVPAHTVKGDWRSKPRHVSAYGVVSHQPWQKTCRAYARVHGSCAAVYCDDTVITFTRLASGRVRQSARKAAQINWYEPAPFVDVSTITDGDVTATLSQAVRVF